MVQNVIYFAETSSKRSHAAMMYQSGLPQTHYAPNLPPASLQTPMHSKPKVGLAVICRCTDANTSVQCLLQKRGSNSCSPNKWSFPGGRLDEPGDMEEDGAVGTKRELKEECGGGAPPGLPPLIHIECCKSGKAKQTIYHVFVVDNTTGQDWTHWQPKPTDSCTNVDQSSHDLLLGGQTFRCIHGYCWVDMSVLIEECFEQVQLPEASENSELQYGLVRWVYNFGEHILKTLIARSPKIPHSRRLSNTNAPSNGFGTSLTALPHPRSAELKPRRFPQARAASLMQAPFGTIPHHLQMAHLYRMQQNSAQLSPTGNTNLSALGSPLNNVAVNDTPPNVLLPLHHHHQPNIMFYPPPSNQIQVSPEKVPLMHSAPGLLQQPPGLLQQQTPGGLHHPHVPLQQPSTENVHLTHANSPVTEETPPTTTHVPPRANLVSEVSPTPVVMPTAQTLSMLGHTHQNMALDPHQLSILGARHISTATALSSPEQALLPTVTTQIPPQEDKMGMPSATNVLTTPIPVRVGNSGPLLPNPPGPIVPQGNVGALQNLPTNPQSNLRKETLCKHYLIGVCPYGDKCWFAHPEPIGPTHSSAHKGYADSAPSTTPIYGSQQQVLQNQPPGGHNMWFNNQMIPQFGLTSPPQSPLNTGGVVTVPSGHLGGLTAPRYNIPLQQQQQLLVLQHRADQGQVPMLPVSVQQNTILRFELLTDLRIVDENRYPVVKISQQTSRADQLYVSFGAHVHNYKILFGGNRPHAQNYYVVDSRNLNEIVSCVHCSRPQAGLLVIGTETGSISLWDLKRGSGHSGSATEVYRNTNHPQSLPKPDDAVCSLVHFATFINSAVVVAGTRGGALTWYISQPPQKTFSILFSDCTQHTQHSIISLQVLGSHLLSGDVTGRVVLWNMQTQSPFVQVVFFPHSTSLINLHVVDSAHFLTVGTGSSDDHLPNDSHHSSTSSGEQLEGGKNLGPLETLTGGMSQLTLTNTPTTTISNTGTTSSHDLNKFNLNLWAYNSSSNAPPKLVTAHTEEGVVNSTSFHCHTPPGSSFLAAGLKGNTIKIYNLPSFKIATELHFPEMKGCECSHITINHSREAPVLSPVYLRNPFRDLILTTVWSDGRIMVCQVAKQ